MENFKFDEWDHLIFFSVISLVDLVCTSLANNLPWFTSFSSGFDLLGRREFHFLLAVYPLTFSGEAALGSQVIIWIFLVWIFLCQLTSEVQALLGSLWEGIFLVCCHFDALLWLCNEDSCSQFSSFCFFTFWVVHRGGSKFDSVLCLFHCEHADMSLHFGDLLIPSWP